MPDDPTIAYAGPESRSIEVEVILFGGSAPRVRGVIANAETSAGEAGQPFADAGPLGWIAYDGDPKQIEFVQYVDPATRRRIHRRVIKGERIGSQWNTVKLNMAREAVDLGTQGEFDARDFSPLDFNTG